MYLYPLKVIYLVLTRFQPLSFVRELLMFFQEWYVVNIEFTVLMGGCFLNFMIDSFPCRGWFFLSLLFSSFSLSQNVLPVLPCGCIFYFPNYSLIFDML